MEREGEREIDIRRRTENERLIPTALYYFISAAELGQGNPLTLSFKAISGHMLQL